MRLWFYKAGLAVSCALVGHPPAPLAYGAMTPEQLRVLARSVETAGGTYVEVQCACGRKMVRLKPWPEEPERMWERAHAEAWTRWTKD